MKNFNNKKIGIWGYGIVGASALRFFDQYNLISIEILHNQQIDIPQTCNKVHVTLQSNQESITNFFNHNDYILISPGIALHNYQQYQYKLISETDLFYYHNHTPTIAITGSLGKTTVTHLLTTILQHNNYKSFAAGNIGYPLLQTLIANDGQDLEFMVLELSSFQLQQSQHFAPDLAIITNIYENHLDHHKSMQEYIDAKCKIFINQSKHQKVLIPYQLASHIPTKPEYNNQIIYFSHTPLATYNDDKILYYLDQNRIYKKEKHSLSKIYDIDLLQDITFAINWLIIIAALDSMNLLTKSFHIPLNLLQRPDFRLQKIATIHNSDIYNDSKSTVWQATLQAVHALYSPDKPMKLFLGGLSKGVDRTPLLQQLADKNIHIYAFGKEAHHIGLMCKALHIKYDIHINLETSVQACLDQLKQPSVILFSPAGSSYDLFKNYQERGNAFTKYIHEYQLNIKKFSL